MSPTLQDLSNDTTFSQIRSRVPVPLKQEHLKVFKKYILTSTAMAAHLDISNATTFRPI